MFACRPFAESAKSYVETIIKSTVESFKDRLPELDWLDEPTRKAAEDKALAIKVKIGYATSPNVTDPVSLRNYYAVNRPIKAEYFESVLGTRMTEERRKWFQIGKQRDPGVWDMIPSEVCTSSSACHSDSSLLELWADEQFTL